MYSSEYLQYSYCYNAGRRAGREGMGMVSQVLLVSGPGPEDPGLKALLIRFGLTGQSYTEGA